MKKFLTFVLVLAMVLSVSSVALANVATVTDAEAVAKIGDNLYGSLKDAMTVIQDGDTVTLLSNITIDTETYKIPKGVSITLDMNGKKITATDDKATGNYELFYLDTNNGGGGGTLTVTGNGIIELTSTYNRNWNALSAIFHNRGGELTIENGSFTHKGGTDMAYVVDNSGNWSAPATTNINGGTLESSYTGIRNRMDAQPNSFKVTLNVTGGTIIGGSRAIWAQASSTPSSGEINISGGTIGYIYTSSNNGAASMLNVSGGTVESIKAENGEVSITGGHVKNGMTIVSAAGEEVSAEDMEKMISGGTFGFEPDVAMIAAGKVAAKSGEKWVVADKVNVTFNANEGTGTMAAQTFGKGVAQALTANAFTREGYAFLGWNTVADGSGTKYDDKAEVAFDADTELFAQWAKLEAGIETKPAEGNAMNGAIDTSAMKSEEIEEIFEAELEEDEKDKDVDFILEVKELDEKVIDKAVVETIAENVDEEDVLVGYLDINLYKVVDYGTPDKIEDLSSPIAITIELDEVVEGRTYYIIRVHNGVAERIDGTRKGNKFTFYTDRFSTYALAHEETPVYSGTGIKVQYMGGNSFSTTNSDTPIAVEIDGVPVSFTGNGKYFTVGCIQPGADWVTVKWHGTTVTTNFTPDVTVVCTQVGLPKTGDVSVMAYALMAVIAAAGAMLKK